MGTEGSRKVQRDIVGLTAVKDGRETSRSSQKPQLVALLEMHQHRRTTDHHPKNLRVA